MDGALVVTQDALDSDQYIRLVEWLNWIHDGNCIIEYRQTGQIGPLDPNEAQLDLVRLMLRLAATCPRCGKLIEELDPVCRACTEATGRLILRGVPGRIIILKARKDGFSTLIQSWGAFNCETQENISALTVAHTDDSTKTIFIIATRIIYRGKLPLKRARTIAFPTSSRYSCVTAGGQAPGSGGTNTILHESEMAKWKRGSAKGQGSTAPLDAEAHTSLSNSVPLAPHTWIFNESTGMGPGGEFYRQVKAAQKRESEYHLLFVPWYRNQQNQIEPPADFTRTADEQAMAEQFGLNDRQLAWRRMKMREAAAENDNLALTIFRREFPSTPDEAFTALEGRIYPTYDDSPRFVKSLPLDRFIKSTDNKVMGLARGIDEGYSGDHPFVFLWIAYDNSKPAQLVIDPSCEHLRNEMLSYLWDPKTDLPEKKNDHGPDALRGVIVRLKLGGLVYVYRELYFFGAEQKSLDQMTIEMLRLSGCRPRNEQGVDPSNPKWWENGEEIYRRTVIDRAAEGVVRQYRTWGIKGARPTVIPKIGSRSTGNERKDGILLVNTLISGTLQLYPLDAKPGDIEALEMGVRKHNREYSLGRPVTISNQERDAVRRRQIEEAKRILGSGEDETIYL